MRDLLESLDSINESDVDRNPDNYVGIKIKKSHSNDWIAAMWLGNIMNDMVLPIRDVKSVTVLNGYFILYFEKEVAKKLGNLRKLGEIV